MVREDEKYRYAHDKRIEIYQGLVKHARNVLPGIKIQLSTEQRSVWDEVKIK